MTNLIDSPNQERADEDEIKTPKPRPVELPKEAISWRILRLCIAIPLLAISFAALFPFAVLPVSTQAVVNSRLSLVKAPSEGELGRVTLETGDSVVANQVLATTSIPHTTLRSESLGVSHVRSDMEQESARVGASLAASQQEKSRYDQMYSQYLQHVAADLALQVREAERASESAQRKAASSAEEVKRSQDAMKDHLISRPMLDQVTDKAEQVQRDADTKSAALRRLQQQLADAKAGYILDPSMTPPFMSARDNATSELERLLQEKASLDRQLKEAGSVPTDDLSTTVGQKTTIVSPVSGTIWSRSVATGQTVQEGTDLFRIADANSIHVEVWLDRRYGPELSIGDTALVYLSGLGKELSGRVTSFEGTNRRLQNEEVNAIDLQPVHPDQYHVSIELAPEDRKAMYIGQSAKVLFPGSGHRIRAGIYFWLKRM